MVELKIVDIIGYSTEDPKHPAVDLMSGKKWLSAKNYRSIVNEVTLQLEKCAVLSAIDIGNHGTAIIAVEVSRTGLRSYRTLISGCEFMTRKESVEGKNLTSVKMFSKEDMCESIRDEKWDRVKIICTQPFTFCRGQFGLSFVRVFSYEERVPCMPSSTSPQSTFSMFSKLNPSDQLSSSLSRSERLMLEATRDNNQFPNGSSKCSEMPHTSETTREHSPTGRLGHQQLQRGADLDERRSDIRSHHFSVSEHIASGENSERLNPSPYFNKSEISKKRESKDYESSNFKRSRPTPNSTSGSSELRLDSPHHFRKDKRGGVSDDVDEQSEGSSSIHSDNTLLIVPSSPDSGSSAPTVTLIRSSSEESNFKTALPMSPTLGGTRRSTPLFKTHVENAWKSNARRSALPQAGSSQESTPCVVISDSDSDNSIETQSSARLSSDDRGKRGTKSSAKEVSKWKSVTCPLCSKNFPASSIEAHAAYCEPTSDEADGGECPVCLKFLPIGVLMRHADLCVERLQ